MQEIITGTAGAFKLQPPPHAAETGAGTPVLARKAAPPNEAVEADGSRRASDASSVASVCSMALACAPTAEFASALMSQHNLLFEVRLSCPKRLSQESRLCLLAAELCMCWLLCCGLNLKGVRSTSFVPVPTSNMGAPFWSACSGAVHAPASLLSAKANIPL